MTISLEQHIQDTRSEAFKIAAAGLALSATGYLAWGATSFADYVHAPGWVGIMSAIGLGLVTLSLAMWIAPGKPIAARSEAERTKDASAQRNPIEQPK